MYGIELLVEEHRNILRFTDYVNELCGKMLAGEEPDTAQFRKCLDFGRNYADKQHHGKEEKILFRIMEEHLGSVAHKLVQNGMLVEHDLGRYHMSSLEEALDAYEKQPNVAQKLAIVVHAAGYAELLKRHIEKEDGVVYTFAERSLSEELKNQVNEETERFEKDAAERGVPERYLAILKEWGV